MRIFNRIRNEEAKNEQGINCVKDSTVCELGNKAITLYGAVWYGGACDTCDTWKKGDFIGNFPLGEIDQDGNTIAIPMDESLKFAIAAGLEVQYIE